MISKVTSLVAVALMVLAGLATPPVAAQEMGAATQVALVPAEDGRALAWGGGSALTDDGALVIEPGAPGELTWDLTALDRAAYRSDLVRIEVLEVDGPGRLTVREASRHHRDVTLFDGRPTVDGATALVLQVGRATTQQWTIDRPGVHTVDLRASIPLAGGGTAETTSSHRFQVGDDGDAASDVAPPASERATSAAPAAAAPAAAPRQAGERVVIADGHVDMGPRIVDGRWRVQLKDDTVTPFVWRDLSDVVLHATDAAIIQVPDREAYAFLGPAGTSYHLLPQTQRQGVLWPGWNTQDPSVVNAVPGSVTWRLRSVDGPGRFTIFMTDSFGDTEVLFDTDRSLPQDLAIPRNSHVHGNWAFGAPGVYRLEVEMRATSGSGAALSDTRILTVVVGDGEDPGAVAPGDPGGPGQEVPDGDDEGSAEVTISAGLGQEGADADDDGPGGTPGGGSGEGSGGGAGGSLAQTGMNVLGPVVVALLALAIGFALVRLARASRRPHPAS